MKFRSVFLLSSLALAAVMSMVTPSLSLAADECPKLSDPNQLPGAVAAAYNAGRSDLMRCFYQPQAQLINLFTVVDITKDPTVYDKIDAISSIYKAWFEDYKLKKVKFTTKKVVPMSKNLSLVYGEYKVWDANKKLVDIGEFAMHAVSIPQAKGKPTPMITTDLYWTTEVPQ